MSMTLSQSVSKLLFAVTEISNVLQTLQSQLNGQPERSNSTSPATPSATTEQSPSASPTVAEVLSFLLHNRFLSIIQSRAIRFSTQVEPTWLLKPSGAFTYTTRKLQVLWERAGGDSGTFVLNLQGIVGLPGSTESLLQVLLSEEFPSLRQNMTLNKQSHTELRGKLTDGSISLVVISSE